MWTKHHHSCVDACSSLPCSWNYDHSLCVGTWNHGQLDELSCAVPAYFWMGSSGHSLHRQNEDLCGCNYAYLRQFGLQTFYHIGHSQLLHDLPGDDRWIGLKLKKKSQMALLLCALLPPTQTPPPAPPKSSPLCLQINVWQVIIWLPSYIRHMHVSLHTLQPYTIAGTKHITLIRVKETFDGVVCFFYQFVSY